MPDPPCRSVSNYLSLCNLLTVIGESGCFKWTMEGDISSFLLHDMPMTCMQHVQSGEQRIASILHAVFSG